MNPSDDATDNQLISPVKNKTAQILVIEPSDSTRLILSEALRGAGYSSIVSMSKLPDGISYLEAESADLLFCATFREEKINLLGLLKIALANPALQNLNIVALGDATDHEIILKAYELGLQAHILKPLSGQTAKMAIDSFFARLSENNWNLTWAAADYLRELLQSRPSELLTFERNFCKAYEHPSFLLHLAKAQLLSQDEGSGRATLWQATQIQQNLTAPANKLLMDFFGSDGAPSEKPPYNLKAAGIKSCAIVDADQTVCRAIEGIMKEQQIEQIAIYSNGQECWDAFAGQSMPDLIIQEWRLAGISGAALLQRIRAKPDSQTVVIILSSLLKKSDQPLLTEMGVDLTVEKPLNKNELLNAVNWSLKQDRFCATRTAIEKKIRRLLRARRHGEAQQWRTKLLSKKDYPKSAADLLAAEFAFAEEKYLESRNLALACLEAEKSNHHAINILSKSLFKLRDFQAALKFFEKAKEYSPANIERLCMIAEAKTELNDVAGAAKEIEGISSLDHDSPQLKETKAKAELARGDFAACQKTLKGLQLIGDVVSFANNRAVALANDNRVGEAIELYKTALKSLPDNAKKYYAVVSYNLCLALCKEERLDDAFAVGNAIDLASADFLMTKVTSLLKRIQKAMSTGEKILLYRDPNDSVTFEGSASASDFETSTVEKRTTAPALKKACHKLYIFTGKSGYITTMLAEIPVFNSRSALKRS